MSNTVEVKRNMIDTIFVANKDSNPYIAKTIALWKEENKGNYIIPLIHENGYHYGNCSCLACFLSKKTNDELRMLGTVHKIEQSYCNEHHHINDCQCHQNLINKNFGVLNYGWTICNNKRCSYCYGRFQGQL
jgi:hypothetical protein